MLRDAYKYKLIVVMILPVVESDRISNVGFSLGVSEAREVSLLAKYANFTNVFSKEGALELPEANSWVRRLIIIKANK
jgi:hypothetical protein